jgi:hypothetical protein
MVTGRDCVRTRNTGGSGTAFGLTCPSRVRMWHLRAVSAKRTPDDPRSAIL